MVQFNLLPNVKLEYVKTQQTKRLLALVSVVVSAVSLGVLLLAFLTVNVAQKTDLHHLDSDIATRSSALKSVNNLDKILTVQNQLSTLGSLHDKKPVASRLFGYISQVTPTQASLNKLTVDFTANTMTVGGTAPSLDVVSAYTDTLKSVTYSISGDVTNPSLHPFTNVVLSSFSRDTNGASFNITCSFDPAIFLNANSVKQNGVTNATTDQSSVFGGGN